MSLRKVEPIAHQYIFSYIAQNIGYLHTDTEVFTGSKKLRIAGIDILIRQYGSEHQTYRACNQTAVFDKFVARFYIFRDSRAFSW